ncbi:MAG: hypothetical protein Q7S50_02930 [bacterium]|nr:hypothetical protein [bacterium]
MRKLLFILVFALLPLPALAQTDPPYQYARKGIFDCNLNGAYAMSIGSMAATGGVYVPVADATVELNTGILVYKECILREVIDRQREAATSAFGKRAIVGVTTGRDGKPLYVVNEGQEILTGAIDSTMLGFLQGEKLKSLNTSLQGPITRTLVRNYDVRTRAPQKILTCPYQGNLLLVHSGLLPTGVNIWDAVAAAGSAPCDPLSAFYLSEELAGASIARAEQYQQDQWTWGRGYYPVTDSEGNVVTPAATVQESFQRILDSPVYQLESANDIGQMIGALYAGMTTQIITNDGGLAGITQGIGGQPSYLDQITQQSSQGLRNAVVNAALNLLAAARQVEATYLQAVNAIGAVLTQTIAQLRSAEEQCWNLVVPRVCENAPVTRDNTCVASGTTYEIATSTEKFAQNVIDAQIAELASTMITNIEKSENALRLIEELIQGVTNTTSPDAQRRAIEQLDALIARDLIHKRPDVDGPTGVLQQLTNVRDVMSTLVTNTVQAWADNANPAVGWCNVNNPAVIQGWKDKWRK